MHRTNVNLKNLWIFTVLLIIVTRSKFMNRSEVCKFKHIHELVKIIGEFVIDNIVHVLYSYLYCNTNRDKLLM